MVLLAFLITLIPQPPPHHQALEYELHRAPPAPPPAPNPPAPPGQIPLEILGDPSCPRVPATKFNVSPADNVTIPLAYPPFPQFPPAYAPFAPFPPFAPRASNIYSPS